MSGRLWSAFGPEQPLEDASTPALAHSDEREEASYQFGEAGSADLATVARKYTQRGWAVVPVNYRGKKPTNAGWQNATTGQNIERCFRGTPVNIGVVLGEKSGGLTDIDCDCPEAIFLAAFALPKTDAIFGRQSAPASHFLYRTSLADTAGKAVINFDDPRAGGRLLELRVGGVHGAQTVFPGSVHASGEQIRWDEEGQPALVAGDELFRRAKVLAALCLMARYWPTEGLRHTAALVIGGFLSRCGYSPPHVRELVDALARCAGDEEHHDRKRAAEDAALAHQRGENAAGYPALNKMFGADVSKQIADWLNYAGAKESDQHGVDAEEAFLPVSEEYAALEFVRQHGNNFKFNHTDGNWYIWKEL